MLRALNCFGWLQSHLVLVVAWRFQSAGSVFLLASSLDFLQGTFEKIHLQGLLCQKLFQAMDFLAVSRCVRAGSRRFLSWFDHLQLPAPLVEAPRSHPQFSC